MHNQESNDIMVEMDFMCGHSLMNVYEKRLEFCEDGYTIISIFLFFVYQGILGLEIRIALLVYYDNAEREEKERAKKDRIYLIIKGNLEE